MNRPLRTPRVVRRRLEPAPGSGCGAPSHGTYTAVREAGCRCPDALEDRYRYEKRQTTGRLPAAVVDGTGTTRKLQALNALGYGGKYLAERLESTTQHVLKLMAGEKTAVHRLTAGRVDEVYRELSAVPAKWNPGYYPRMSQAERESRVRRTVERAQGRGFVSPMRWDGRSIDDPAAQPEPPTVPQSESAPEDAAQDAADAVGVLVDSGADPERLREAYQATPRKHRGAVVAALTRKGLTAQAVADKVGSSVRQVERYRAASRREDTAEAVADARAAVEESEVAELDDYAAQPDVEQDEDFAAAG